MSKNTVNSICRCQTEKKHHFPTCHEWIQLLVAFSVPVAIALYTFVQNNNEQTIALANRQKDLEISRNQRAQDLQIADDQQKANILAAYESFLVSHLNRYGMILNESSSARFVARFKTLTTVSQLDPTRKTFLIQSLFEAKLIVNDINSSNPYDPGIISLEKGDLSQISFENRDLKYLSLPGSNLTRAKFAFAELSCVNFHCTILINTSFHRADVLIIKDRCFVNSSHTIFVEAIMTNTDLSEAQFIATDFSGAILNYANMRGFVCLECLYAETSMYHTDLSFARISMNSIFKSTNLTEAVFVSAVFRSTTFHDAKFIQIQATKVNFAQCSFASMRFSSCILDQTLIVQTNFSNVYFNDVNFSKSNLTKVSFIDSSMYYTDLSDTVFNQCTFINANFNGSIMKNTSFLNCVFQQSFVSNEQRLQIATFNGSVFS